MRDCFVVYRLDENGEATGLSLRFCCENCRDLYFATVEDVDPAGFGTESIADAPDGWACDYCNISLEGGEAAAEEVET